MSTEIISSKNIRYFKSLMPDELGQDVKDGLISGIGAWFADEPAGVILYRGQGSEQADLLYIYVEPEYRRLGVGSELIEATECTYFNFIYEATGDRVTLEPFFDAVDIMTERVDYPFSELSLKQIKEEFLKHSVLKAQKKGSFFDEMESDEKAVVSKWMMDEYGVSITGYSTDKPKSIFSVRDGHTDSAVLLSEMNDDTLNLDYIYSARKNKGELLGMLHRAFRKALSDYGTESYIRMMPKTDDGMNLYNKLFGEVTDTVPVIVSV